jgi:hypothetical protein
MEINVKNIPFGADSKFAKLLNGLHFKCYNVAGSSTEFSNVILSLYNNLSTKFTMYARMSCEESTFDKMINSIPVKDFTFYNEEKKLHVKLRNKEEVKLIVSQLEQITDLEIVVFDAVNASKVELYYQNALKTNQTVFNNIVILKSVIRYLSDKTVEILYQEPLKELIHSALNNYSFVK